MEIPEGKCVVAEREKCESKKEEGCKVDGETGLARAGGAHDHHHLVLAAVEGRRVDAGPALYPVGVGVGLQNGKSHNNRKKKKK